MKDDGPFFNGFVQSWTEKGIEQSNANYLVSKGFTGVCTEGWIKRNLTKKQHPIFPVYDGKCIHVVQNMDISWFDQPIVENCQQCSWKQLKLQLQE